MTSAKTIYAGCDQKLEIILREAAHIFARKGFRGATIRDIARQTGISLAGLYYYFRSKDELLFLIQKHCFEWLTLSLEQQLEGVADPVARLRLLVKNHLEYFLTNMREMKVLSHEAESLDGAFLAEIEQIKRRYYKICLSVVQELINAGKMKELNPRITVMSLLGMMNWIYNWYDAKRDGKVHDLANPMTEIFLRGILR
ncbi:MAG: TetR/AcrR family transcriptional regulator [Acidobacteria bacterium]|nr:TetR/AcrR family transcriptional regulator [Acidobacteriota bacterium]MBI3658591.1 TetR/AcrR family transcriptional regulator [Acidobacteriota bacterium]